MYGKWSIEGGTLIVDIYDEQGSNYRKIVGAYIKNDPDQMFRLFERTFQIGKECKQYEIKAVLGIKP